jgi:hypothetical protein
VDGKSHYQLGLKISSLPKGAICNPYFVKTLFDPLFKKRYENFATKYKEYNAQDIYSRIIPYLMTIGKREAIPESVIPFSTPQRGGSCFWSSCLPHLQKELGAKYKEFRLNNKKDTLEDYSSRMGQNPENVFLVLEALKNFARTELKQNDPDTTKALELIEKCKKRVEEENKVIEANREEKLNLEPGKVRPNPLNTKEYISLDQNRAISPLERIKRPNISDSASLEDKITALNDWGKAIDESKETCTSREKQDFLHSINKVILPLSIESLKNLDSALMSQIFSLANFMTLATDTPTPENILTFSKLQIAAYETACKKDKRLEEFRPANGLLEIMKYNGFYILKSPELERQNQEVIKYLESKETTLFSYFNERSVSIQESNFFAEENLLSDEGKKNLTEYAEGEHKKYRARVEQNNSLPNVSEKQFQKACLLADLGGVKAMDETLLQLKRLSYLSFSIDDMRNPNATTLPINTPSRGYNWSNDLSVEISVEPSSKFAKYYQNAQLNLPDLQKKSDEISICSKTPKGGSEKNIDRIKRLFGCIHTPGYRLDFILNTMGEQLSYFKERNNQLYYEAFAFCVDSTVLKEIEKNPLLANQVKEFLSSGFDYFVTHQHEIDYNGALFFLRTAASFAKFFSNETFLDKTQILDAWLKNNDDPQFQALIHIHKCLLMNPNKELDEEAVFSLLAADTLQETFGLDKFYKDGALVNEFKMLRAANEERIKTWFAQNKGNENSILNRLSQLFDSNFTDHKWSNEYPNFTSENYKWNFTKCKFSTPKGYSSPPPTDLKEFYGEKIQKGFNLNEEFTFSHKTLGDFTKSGNNLYRHFKDKENEPPALCYNKNPETIHEFYKKNKIEYEKQRKMKDLDPHPYPERLQGLVDAEKTLACRTSKNEILFIDTLSGKETYRLGKDGLIKLPEEILEGRWDRVTEYLPAINTVIKSDHTFLFDKLWEFPNIKMNDGKMLILEVKDDGTVCHKDLGILKKKSNQGIMQEGLHFIHPTSEKEFVLFPNARFVPAKSINRTGTTSDTDWGTFNSFIFEKNEKGDVIPKNDEERVFLIGFYLAKNEFAMASRLFDQ